MMTMALRFDYEEYKRTSGILEFLTSHRFTQNWPHASIQQELAAHAFEK